MSMEELKKLLLSFKEEDYCKNVDLHIHSDVSDGKMKPDEIYNSAKKLNMKYICISDHNAIDAYEKICPKDDIIIPGAEFDCVYKGIYIHILAYGIDLENDELKSILSDDIKGKKCKITRLFRLRDAKKVIDIIHCANGLAILAHPACYWVINLENFILNLKEIGLDGLEVYYPYKRWRSIIKFHSRKTVLKIAKKLNLIQTGGSDSHGKKYYNFSLTKLSI